MLAILGSVFLLLGSAFVLVASIGIVRMPDLMMRMHASTKAGTLGAGLMSLAIMIFFPEISVWTRAVALIFFVLLTAPVAAHMIGRAAYYGGVELWEGTFVDELKDYHEETKDEVRQRILAERGADQPPGQA